MRKILTLFIMLLVACRGTKKEVTEETITRTLREGKRSYMFIDVKDYGRIVIKMYPDYAPKNVANIVKLAEKGYYNGVSFHRVIDGFVIQGGDPSGTGAGGLGYTVEDEISPDLKHLKGTVAMANRGPNTNGSQFYICLVNLPHLDGCYTIIGEVVEGMDVVERIATVKTTGSPYNKPKTPVIMQKVWIEYKKD